MVTHTVSRCFVLWFLIFAAPLLSGAEIRTFTGANGHEITAELLNVRGEQAFLRLADGREMWVLFDLFSEEDQGFLRETAPLFRAGDDSSLSPADVNRLLGLELFADHNLWENRASDVASRLGWPRESATDFQESYRVYPGPQVRVGGARPHSAVLYGSENKAAYLSLIFANKGDGASQRSQTNPRQAEREIQNDIRDDGRVLQEALSALGEPKRQVFGPTGPMQERPLRWDWEEHAFLLTIQAREYTALRIMPVALADAQGRPSRTRSDLVAAHMKEQVLERENGDVILANIPMVDQGPKGYCVPATLERYLRYMNIPADMYVLAMAGSTGVGGGTSLSDLIEGTETWVSSHGRRLRRVSVRMQINDIARSIDAGQPLLWAMYNTSEYNRIVNGHTRLRAEVGSADEWQRRLRELRREAPRIELDGGGAHVCLIIGYNRQTKEIAVSDSWGPSYAERWVCVEAAADVSQDWFMRIDP